MSVNAMKEEFDVVELFGQYALFTNARIDRGTVPAGWHCYDIRGSDEDPGELAALEPKVSVNHAGTVLSPRPIPFPDGQDYLDIREEIGFAECCDITLAEFRGIYGIDTQAQETADLKITDVLGRPVTLRPRVELYSVKDFMGRDMPGLALDFDEVGDGSEPLGPYATLTKSFGEFISIKNAAYIDTNNCSFAGQLLEQGTTALEMEHCHTLRFALDISQNLRCYDWVPSADLEESARGLLLDAGVSEELIHACGIDLAGYKAYLLEGDGYSLSADGSYIRRNDMRHATRGNSSCP